MTEFLKGADLSSLLEVERCGGRFYDLDGREDDAMRILARHGVNHIRLRLWNDPKSEAGESYGGGGCDLDTVRMLARQAKEYSESFTPLAFDTVYGFKEAFCDNATKITVGELTDRLERYAANGSAVSYRVSKETGYLVYGVDGYENITAENVTPEIVNSYPIEASELSSGSNINMGDMAYKLIVSENWKAAFTVTPDYAALFENGQNVKVRFAKNGEELTGKVTLVPGATEKSDVLMMISFKTSVCNFAADRFADIEIQRTFKPAF